MYIQSHAGKPNNAGHMYDVTTSSGSSLEAKLASPTPSHSATGPLCWLRFWRCRIPRVKGGKQPTNYHKNGRRHKSRPKTKTYIKCHRNGTGLLMQRRSCRHARPADVPATTATASCRTSAMHGSHNIRRLFFFGFHWSLLLVLQWWHGGPKEMTRGSASTENMCSCVSACYWYMAGAMGRANGPMGRTKKARATPGNAGRTLTTSAFSLLRVDALGA